MKNNRDCTRSANRKWSNCGRSRRLIVRRIVLNVTGKHAQFCNSNDVNQLRKSNPRTREKKFESYKKSFQDGYPRKDTQLRMKDARSHKAKKYTQSYDSNQLNFKFKRRKRAEEKGAQVQKASPKKIRVMHEGRKW